jgi:hypothetical protein
LFQRSGKLSDRGIRLFHTTENAAH